MGFLKGLVKTITGIIAVLLCVVIFVLQIGIHTFIDTKTYLSKESIISVTKNIDLDILLKDEDGKKTELAEEIYDSIKESDIPTEAIDKVLESKSLREIVGGYIGSSIESILYNTEVEKPTVDDLVKLVEDNMDLIEEISKEQGVTITEEDKKELISEVRKNAPELIEELPDITEELKSEDNEVLDIIQEVYKTKYLLLAFGAIIILVGLIALLRFNKISWMMWLSIPTMIAAIIMIVLSFSPPLLITLLKSADISKNILDLIVNNILNGLFTRFLISGLIGLAISIALIVFYKKIRNKQLDDDLFEPEEKVEA